MLTEMRTPDLQPAPTDVWPCAGTPANLLRPTDTDLQPLRDVLAGFEPVTLAALPDMAALLDRSELKFMLPQGLLPPVLAELPRDYRLLVVAGRPCSRYRTLYFDTADLALYRRHHAGALDRYKVRAREYVDSRTAFLEVKHRTGRQRTAKRRISTDGIVTALTPQAAGFLAEVYPYPAEALTGRLWSHYTRITLVSKARAERVTFDLDMACARGVECVGFPGVVVAEVKFQGERHASQFVRLMRAVRVRETSFSKYCMGVSLLYPDVKRNRFKARHRQVARIAYGVDYGLV